MDQSNSLGSVSVYIKNYIDELRDSMPPGIWSQAVQIVRQDGVVVLSQDDQEVLCSVQNLDNLPPVSNRVQVWPQDEDGFCSCRSKKTHACVHIAAAAIFLNASLEKGGGVQQVFANEGASAAAANKKTIVRVAYSLRILDQTTGGDGGVVELERYLETFEPNGVLSKQEPYVFTNNLLSLTQNEPSITANLFRHDFDIERVMQGYRRSRLRLTEVAGVLPLLAESVSVYLSVPEKQFPLKIWPREVRRQLVLSLNRAKAGQVSLQEQWPIQLRTVSNQYSELVTKYLFDPTKSKYKYIKKGIFLYRNPSASNRDEYLLVIAHTFLRDELDLQTLLRPEKYLTQNSSGSSYQTTTLLEYLRNDFDVDSNFSTTLVETHVAICFSVKESNGYFFCQFKVGYFDTEKKPVAWVQPNELELLAQAPLASIKRDVTEEFRLKKLIDDLIGQEGGAQRIHKYEAHVFVELHTQVRQLIHSCVVYFEGIAEKLEVQRLEPVIDLNYRMPQDATNLSEQVLPSLPQLQSFNMRLQTANQSSGLSLDAHDVIVRGSSQSILFHPDYGFLEIPRSFLNTQLHGLEQLQSALEQKTSPSVLDALKIQSLLSKSGALVRQSIDWDDALKNTTSSNLDVRLQNFETTIAPVQLREYQRTGIRWLLKLQGLGVGALLADDMGLGKTLQSSAVLTNNSIVAAPKSVLENWRSELSRFRPDLNVIKIDSLPRALKSVNQGVWLVSHHLLRNLVNELPKHVFDVFVVDEAQVMKNERSQVYQAFCAIAAKFKLSLTGTPIENVVREVVNHFQFLVPDLLEAHEWRQLRADRDAFRTNGFQERLKPFWLRRHKREVLTELPECIEHVINVEFEENERLIYNKLYIETKADIDVTLDRSDTKPSAFSLFELLLRLRQVCNDARLIPASAVTEPSSKINALFEHVMRSLECGESCLIYSQFTSMLNLVEDYFKERLTVTNRAVSFDELLESDSLPQAEYPVYRLDGSMTAEKRTQAIDGFQNSTQPAVFLLSLKAGGVGLNLTKAQHVYFIDPWWNPAVEAQAIARAHRMGQKNVINVYRLITRNSIEEGILKLQQSKQLLFNEVFGAETNLDSSVGLSVEEVLSLISSEKAFSP